jgi:hypothetical protein
MKTTRTLPAILLFTAVVAGMFLPRVGAQAPSAAASLATAAADALGGRDRIQAVRSIRMIGYGELIDGFGLSNNAADRYAPMRLNNILEMERTFDVANERMRVQERRRTNFTFANAGANEGLNRVNEAVDGQIAYNVGANGATRAGGNAAIERRLRFFTHPVTAVRTALKAGTALGPIRREGNTAVFSVTTAQNDEFDLGIDPVSSLPYFVRWIIPQQNFGEVTYTTYFTAYMPVNGVQMPSGFTTMQDWRDQTQERLYIDRNVVDGPIADIAAPASVTAPAAAPAAGGRAGGPAQAGAPQAGGAGGGGRGGAPAAPVQLAPGVWRVGGSTVFEFGDHMVMYEANGSEAALTARVQLVNQLVPGKPLTHAIVSHHHDDHASGLRTAVALGLTIISHWSNEETFRELTERKTTKYHDALSRSGQRLKFVPVKDHLELKDARNEVDIYHVINNNHMASGLIAHVPAARLLVEADLTTPNWDYQWWGGSLLDNIEYRKIAVDRVSPVHGVVAPLSDLVAQIERQVQGAKALCARASAAQLFRPGCPVQYTREP